MPDGGGRIQQCEWCEEPIREDEDTRMMPHFDDAARPLRPGFWHIECFIRSLIGGVNHLQGLCTCCGGTEPPDPPWMTRREAAIAAMRYYAMFPELSFRAMKRSRLAKDTD